MTDFDIVRKGVAIGILGGLVGTVLMDTVMVATFLIVGEPAETFFSLVGKRLGGGTFTGLALHNVVGMTGGVVFALGVTTVRSLIVATRRTGITFGLAAGLITIPLGCVPMAIWLNESIPLVVGFSFLPHLVWGTTLGLVMGTWFESRGTTLTVM